MADAPVVGVAAIAGRDVEKAVRAEADPVAVVIELRPVDRGDLAHGGRGPPRRDRPRRPCTPRSRWCATTRSACRDRPSSGSARCRRRRTCRCWRSPGGTRARAGPSRRTQATDRMILWRMSRNGSPRISPSGAQNPDQADLLGDEAAIVACRLHHHHRRGQPRCRLLQIDRDISVRGRPGRRQSDHDPAPKLNLIAHSSLVASSDLPSCDRPDSSPAWPPERSFAEDAATGTRQRNGRPHRDRPKAIVSGWGERCGTPYIPFLAKDLKAVVTIDPTDRARQTREQRHHDRTNSPRN